MNRFLHYFSKLACIAALAYFIRQTWVHYHSSAQDLRLLLLLVADSYAVFAVVIARYSTQVVREPLVVAATVLSSCYFVLLDLDAGPVLLPYRFGRWIQIGGILLQLAAKIALGRGYGLLPANRGVTTAGPYRWLRHPMYLGYFINHMGFLACTFSWRNLLLYGVLYLLVFYRIIREERLLHRDPAYLDYCQRVRYRFLPPVW